MTAPHLLKVMVFPVGTLSFAVPLATTKVSPYPVVQRVMNTPAQIQQSPAVPLQVLHWQDHDVVVLNLDLRDPQQSIAPYPFLLLIQAPQSQGSTPSPLYGVLVSEPPSLLSLPVDTIRPLPASYQQVIASQFARYAAVIPASAQPEQPTTIFLFDLFHALPSLSPHREAAPALTTQNHP